MGVVHLFGPPESGSGEELAKANKGEADENSGESCQVIELHRNKKIARGLHPNLVFKEIETLLVQQGMDLGCEKARADYKVVTYLVQGLIDRASGTTTDRSFLLDTLRHVLAYEEAVNTYETNELFGDLLGRLN